MRLSRQNLERLAMILEDMYGKPQNQGSYPDGVILDEVDKDPLDVLIATILSQATSDRTSSRTYRALKERYRTWDEMKEAPLSEIEHTIREGGLASEKAARLKIILESIAGETGGTSLDFLREWDTKRVVSYLTGFKGVGPKTGACVLLFGLGRPAFPVDTHVLRVMKRLGMAKPKQQASALQAAVEEILPRGLEYDLHVNLIRHGRRTCRAAAPRCDGCALKSLCEWAKGRPSIEGAT